jgi:hypothetical protein
MMVRGSGTTAVMRSGTGTGDGRRRKLAGIRHGGQRTMHTHTRVACTAPLSSGHVAEGQTRRRQAGGRRGPHLVSSKEGEEQSDAYEEGMTGVVECSANGAQLAAQ